MSLAIENTSEVLLVIQEAGWNISDPIIQKIAFEVNRLLREHYLKKTESPPKKFYRIWDEKSLKYIKKRGRKAPLGEWIKENLILNWMSLEEFESLPISIFLISKSLYQAVVNAKRNWGEIIIDWKPLKFLKIKKDES